MPRKADTAEKPHRVPRCFNEAGAVMPRKVAVGRWNLEPEAASMRPGLLCPGRQPEGPAGSGWIALQ